MKVLRTTNRMRLEFPGEAQSRDTVMGVGGVLFSCETGKIRLGGERQRKEELQELSLGSTAKIRGTDDEPESAKQSEDANDDEMKTRGGEAKDQSNLRKQIPHYGSLISLSPTTTFGGGQNPN